MRGLATGRQWEPSVCITLRCRSWTNVWASFDMMGKRLYKTYVNLSNIVVRISDGTPEGKEHAVLVNAHLDSTLPSPGAADDALPVGVMLDCMRVLVETPDWSPKHAIIFCKDCAPLYRSEPTNLDPVFNHAEESLQDGSHLFSTQHPIAKT
jgi:Zn-dependent M28 family amino/carboxypeptidase